MTFGIADTPMNLRANLLKGRWNVGRLMAVIAFVLCLMPGSGVRADSASCMANISSYVAELDALLAKERNHLTPYIDLNKRHFPFRDCEADALLDVVRRSSFIRSIGHHAGQYFIHFSNGKVVVGFTYYASEKKSDPATYTAGWVNK
jgi:hypothetical protein